VEVVTVRVRAADFADAGAELPLLARALERHLQARAALGTGAARRGAGGGPRRAARGSGVRVSAPAAPVTPPGHAAAPTMPDLVRPRRGARHTLDTALRALRALGVDDARVVVESAGAGWAPGSVVRQQPAPGAALGPHARVVLAVAGVGALEALPYALRDVDDSAFGVDPLVALLDNPVHKLRHHLRGGGEFFALRPATR
jgi:hypothetical protein